MNLLKSIFSDDEDHPEPDIRRESNPNSPLNPPHDENNNPDDADDGWSFGGLIKTIAIQSESVIEVYRRDLEEFGSGLVKETEILRETASRAVKDLPASLEAAHGALDGVLKSTSDFISKESLGFSSVGEPESPETNPSLNPGRYSRFEAQLSAIQGDLNTFCGEPEDEEDYAKWKLGFELGDYTDIIGSSIEENGILEGVYTRVVPSIVDHETFWCRYFYRVDKLKQQESVRANLVKRAISGDDDEELSWDVDDEDDDNEDGQNVKEGDGKEDDIVSDGNQNPIENNVARDERAEGNTVVIDSGKSNLDEFKEEEEQKQETVGEVKREAKVKCEEESVKANNDASMVEVKDLGWDEIEDNGSGDEKTTSGVNHGWSPEKVDHWKRLSAVGDDGDDLSWDIEDDEEPVKA